MTPEILARIATARAARDLSDLARLALADTATTASPAERIERARRLRQVANEVVDLVVLAEALGGASWEEIAKALEAGRTRGPWSGNSPRTLPNGVPSPRPNWSVQPRGPAPLTSGTPGTGRSRTR